MVSPYWPVFQTGRKFPFTVSVTVSTMNRSMRVENCDTEWSPDLKIKEEDKDPLFAAH